MNACMTPRARRRFLLTTLLASLCGCAGTDTAQAPNAPTAAPTATKAPAPTAHMVPAGAAPSPPPAPPPPPLPPLLPYEEAIARAAETVISRAPIPEGEPASVVIDPLIDGVTQMQTRATDDIGERLAAYIRAKHRHLEVKPFTARGLAEARYLLIGTFTPINQQGKTEGEREAFRFCLVMIDLRTQKLVSKLVVRAPMGKIDSSPLPFFQDAPLWTRNLMGEAYIKSCQGSKVGDQADAKYIAALIDNAMLAEGMRLYNARKHREARELFARAASGKEEVDARALTGLYLAELKLSHREAANQAFAQLVDGGLKKGGALAVMFQFRSGSAQLAALRNVPQETWLKTIAQRMSETQACAEIAGHSSRDGPEAINERLSGLRAEEVRLKLVAAARPLEKRLYAVGYGSREARVGTGKGDASDALDRRVEIRALDCK